jgi:glutamate-1-semialdehyde 2,1-aminomutase
MAIETARPDVAHNSLGAALGDVERRYTEANPKSHARFEAARSFMPGGNTRTVLHYDPFPVGVVQGNGAKIEDLDGHVYTDFLGEYSAGLYGRSNEVIQAAIREAVDGGMTLGAPNRWEAPFAELICKRFPSIDLVRFTNSGTEANMMALGAARAYTKRDKIMVFDGGYHGGVLYFGSRISPVNAPFDFVFATFNDIEATLKLIEAHATDLAAILLEPMMGSGGCMNAEPDFLRALRDAATKHGIVLIFDEVMTSRMSSGGLQKRLGITPDMTTLGKYLGGGCSFGAFGGRKDIMALFDPTSASYLSHAGTFNNNVLTMAAGYAALSKVFTEEAADALFDKGETLKARLNAIAREKGTTVQVTGSGSIMCIHSVPGTLRRPEDAKDPLPDRRKLIHLEMLMRGYTFADRGYISLNLALRDEDFDGFTHAFADLLDAHGEIWRH